MLLLVINALFRAFPGVTFVHTHPESLILVVCGTILILGGRLLKKQRRKRRDITDVTAAFRSGGETSLFLTSQGWDGPSGFPTNESTSTLQSLQPPKVVGESRLAVK